jgi:hypothetical protein
LLDNRRASLSDIELGFPWRMDKTLSFLQILENDASQVWIGACRDKKDRRKGRRQIMVKRWKKNFIYV